MILYLKSMKLEQDKVFSKSGTFDAENRIIKLEKGLQAI